MSKQLKSVKTFKTFTCTDTLEKKKLLLNMELDFESFYTHIGKFKSNSNSNHQSDFESHN